LLVAADQAMYRAKSGHKLAKISLEKESQVAEAGSANVVELDTDDLASVSVN
jgi:hypothetical protein